MSVAPAGKQPGAAGRLFARPRVRVAETAFGWLLFGCLGLGTVFLGVLLVYILVQAWPRLDARLVANFPSVRHPERAGAQSAILGTVWVTACTALFCLPIGIMAALYLEEYATADRWYHRLIELNLQNLAAVPSIIYGILGLGLLARGLALGTTVLTASLTLSLLVLPVVVIASREALRSVPQSIRQASYALGATQWQTIRRQVLPAAVPGIATGSILALSRAIGEAAPLLLLGAMTYVAFDPDGLGSAYTVLPIQIYGWISQSREEFRRLAAAGIVVLLLLLIAVNATAVWLRNRYGKRW